MSCLYPRLHRGGSISKPGKMSVPEGDLTGGNFGGLFLEEPLIQSGCKPSPIRPALEMYQHRSRRRSQVSISCVTVTSSVSRTAVIRTLK